MLNRIILRGINHRKQAILANGDLLQTADYQSIVGGEDLKRVSRDGRMCRACIYLF